MSRNSSCKDLVKNLSGKPASGHRQEHVLHDHLILRCIPAFVRRSLSGEESSVVNIRDVPFIKLSKVHRWNSYLNSHNFKVTGSLSPRKNSAIHTADLTNAWGKLASPSKHSSKASMAKDKILLAGNDLSFDEVLISSKFAVGCTQWDWSWCLQAKIKAL